MDLLNKRSQCQEALQSRIHVTRLTQVGQSERTENQSQLDFFTSESFSWISGGKMNAGTYPRQTRTLSTSVEKVCAVAARLVTDGSRLTVPGAEFELPP